MKKAADDTTSKLGVRMHQLAALFAEIDMYGRRKLNWSQFSQALMTSAFNQALSQQLTQYHPH